MNLDDIQHQLVAMANAGDPTFSQFANDINNLVEQAKVGQLSNADLTEILRDAQSQLAILEDMSDLSFKETLNVCINGLITIAAWTV
jgi:hypothetical protein